MQTLGPQRDVVLPASSSALNAAAPGVLLGMPGSNALIAGVTVLRQGADGKAIRSFLRDHQPVASFPRFAGHGAISMGRLQDNSPYYDAFVRGRPPMPSTPQGGSPRCAR
jgi:hypothetical protein